MPASRLRQYQKSTKNKTQNRLDLIYRTSLNNDLFFKKHNRVCRNSLLASFEAQTLSGRCLY